MIVLDEPTNDLDSETLELLEERLVQFEGTVLLVSHDRAFLNNVVTSSIVFEQVGKNRYLPKEYVGGYDDWLRQRPQSAGEENSKPKGKQKNMAVPTPAALETPPERKLTYNEQRELKSLPVKIEKLEAGIADLHAVMAAPGFYQKPSDHLATKQQQLQELEANLAVAYGRWETLE